MAYLDLLRENPQVPTAAAIASRAGYSTRSLFEHFSDLLALSLAAANSVRDEILAQSIARNVDADRATRIRSQVETRSLLCDNWLALWRALVLNQHHADELKARIDGMRTAVIQRLKLMYRPELSTVPKAEREQFLIALESLTDMESWGRMRERHGLSIEAAQAVWIKAIDRLLPPTPSTSPTP
ncbi:MAG: hypothetical protein ACHQK9_08495 [Reyranellales bacterium]